MEDPRACLALWTRRGGFPCPKPLLGPEPAVNATGWVLAGWLVATESRESIGAWWDPEVWQRARAAYMYDLRHQTAAPAGFIQWLHWVIELHIRRGVLGRRELETPPRRELAGKADPQHPERVVGLTRHHPLRADLVVAMDAAIRADQDDARYLTRSAWIQDAVQAAIADADGRAGRRLPPLPEGIRLPNQPRKSGSAVVTSRTEGPLGPPQSAGDAP